MSSEVILSIKSLKEQLTAQLNVATALLVDTTKSTTERWALLEELVETNALDCMGGDPYGSGFVSVLGKNVSIYDDFYIERYETASFISMYEGITENTELLNSIGDSALNSWMEEVFKYVATYHSVHFTYNW